MNEMEKDEEILIVSNTTDLDKIADTLKMCIIKVGKKLAPGKRLQITKSNKNITYPETQNALNAANLQRKFAADHRDLDEHT